MSEQGSSERDPRRQPPVTPPQWAERPGWQQPQYPPYGQPWPDPRSGYGPPRRRRSRKGLAFLGCGGLLGLVIIFIIVAVAVAPSSPAPSSAAVPEQATATTAATGHARAAAAQTVTYEVTGSAADVTYGPAGSSFTGSVPLRVTKPLGTPAYYSVTAQLQGSGAVSCKILVGSVTVASATASGGYQIADCEIVQDPFSGKWEDANQG